MENDSMLEMITPWEPSDLFQVFPPPHDYAQLSPDAYMEPAGMLWISVESRLTDKQLEALLRPRGLVMLPLDNDAIKARNDELLEKLFVPNGVVR